MSEIPTADELREERQREEERELIDLGEIFKTKISENKGVFSEAVRLNTKGKISWETVEGNLASKFVHLAISNQDFDSSMGFEPIYNLAKKVSEKSPNLQFNFEPDQEGQSIKYTVIDTQYVAK